MTIDRRTLIAGAGAALALSGDPAAALGAKAMRKTFPRGFLWGASTAGHQIEGNNVNADLWMMENLAIKTFKERSGDACDSYHRGDEDIALLKRIGLNSYRFSVEWSRIEPTRGEFSSAVLDHYKRFIAALRYAGIAPVVTFYHVSAPLWFAEAGGWLNPDSPALFARYCDKVARELGEGMAYACTINEPQVGLTYRVIPQASAYFKAQDELQLRAHDAAAKMTGVQRFITMNHPDIKGMTPQLMLAHKQGYAAIKAARGALPTGVTLNLVDFQPGNMESKYEQLRELAYGPWLEAAKTGDFIGVQTYRQVRVPGPGPALPADLAMPFVKPDQQSEIIKQPTALRNAVEYTHSKTGKPIFVTENGIETENDARRAWYLPQVLGHLHEVIAKGVPVIGYMQWSLLDNFEWLQGFGPKFGLASVDQKTFKRTLKPSSAVLARIARTNTV